MKRFIFGFLTGCFSALIVCVGIFYLLQNVFYVIPPFEKDTSSSEEEEGCKNINPNVKEYGNLKVTLLYKSKPAKNVEVDIAETPGPDNYCYKMTDDKGIAEFSTIPVGTYYIYLNMSNFPKEYGIPSAQKQILVVQGTTLEETIELTDYQK